MHPSTTTSTLLRAAVGLVVLAFLTSTAAFAQVTVNLSKSADFSTNDRLFSADDTLYIRATVPGVDVTAVERSTFEIEAEGTEGEIEGTLANHLDGTFTAKIAVAELGGSAAAWRVKVRIEEDDAEFEARTAFRIQGLDGVAGAVTVRGIVEAAGDGTLSVAGQTIELNADTRIVVAGLLNPGPADLVGRHVVVIARQEGEALVALSVVSRATASGEIKLRGLVRALTDTSITVNAFTFGVDGQTVVRGRDGQVITLADLSVGSFVSIEGHHTADGWIATEVEVEDISGTDDERTFEIEGAIEAVGPASLVISGLRIAVNGDTRFDGVGGLADLSAGMSVDVEFRITRTGQLVAVRVEVEDGSDDDGDGDDGSDDGDEDVEVEGTITAVTETTIEVNGLVFTLTADTRIRGEEGTRLELGDLTTGMSVEVRGERQGDGTLVALRIEVEEEARAELDVRGEVTARTDSSLTVGLTTFLVGPGVEIRGRGDAALTLDDIEVGMVVRAMVIVGTDGQLSATRIRVHARHAREGVKVTGRIEALSATEIVVGPHTFALDGATEVYDRDGNRVGLEVLAEGQVVRVEGRQQDDGSLTAVEIRVRGGAVLDGRMRGPVSSVEADLVTVAGVSFRVSEHTIVKDVDAVTNLTVGERVRVDFRLVGDSTRLALRISRDDDAEAHVELRGIIDAVEADAIVVSGAHILVSDTTSITDRSGATVALGDLAAGQAVRVRANVDGDVLVATAVHVRSVVTVTADVETGGSGSIVVAGQVVNVTDETLIVGRNNEPLTRADIQAGVYVEVLASAEGGSAQKNGSETMTAERIEVLGQAAATGTGDGMAGDVPSGIALDQNYPNPFNPSTTISFEIREAAADASLVIYNLLGQPVRTLSSGAHTPGRHTYTWNGRDEAGRSVASGVYLYRLRVGQQVITRSMMLVK